MREFALPHNRNQPRVFQFFQVMGKRGSGHRLAFPQMGAGHALASRADLLEDLVSSRIGQRLGNQPDLPFRECVLFGQRDFPNLPRKLILSLWRPSGHPAAYNFRMPAFRAALAALVLAPLLAAQEHISLRTRDGGLVYADVYGAGGRGVVLAHGGQFNKESWAKQARALADAGFRVVAIDFRGYGQSRGPGQENIYSAPLHLDILAAVDYLRKSRPASISLIGASMGGSSAADAVAQSPPGAIDRLVILAAAPDHPEKLLCRTLIIVARDDSNGAGPRLPEIRAQYEKISGPKELIVLEGSAHAQFLFQTDQAERVMHEILRFLSAP